MFLSKEKNMSIASCLRRLHGGSLRRRAWRGLRLVLAVVVLGNAQPAAADYIFIDLTPSGFSSFLYGNGVSDGQQVGYGFIAAHWHALLWTGSPDSVVDLTPSGFTDSFAYGVSDGQQVGSGYPQGGGEHALLWTGSADSVVDLHPSEFTLSTATAISDDQQVGYGYLPSG
jgi:hypothetical protein